MALLRFIVQRRRLIIIGTLFSGIIGAVFSLITPAKFKATSCIMPSMDMIGAGELQSSTAAMGMLQFLGGFAITPADIYAEFATNKAIISNLIDKFQLDTVYKAKYRDDLLKKVSKHIETKATSSGLVYISYKDKSPERAALLCNAIIEELDKFNRDIIITKGKRLRIFLGNRLRDIEDSMTLYQDSLVYLQKKYGILDLETSIKSIIQNWQEVEANYFKTKLQYELAQKEYGLNSKIAQNLQKRLKTLAQEKFRIWNIVFDSVANIPALKKLPEIGSKYLQIQLMLSKYTDIYKFITTEYEKAKIMEKQDTPTLQIIFKATVPERRYWPQRKLIVLLFMVAFFFTYITFIVLHFAISQREDGKQTIKLIKKFLLNPLGKD